MIRLGAFELTQPLASGGMATVWRGHHLGQGVPVAVKVLSPGLAREANFVHTLHNEVRAVAGLDHPHIVPVLDYGQVGPEAARVSEGRLSPDSPYVVMEFINGPTLGKVPHLPWTELSRILLELLDALAHAHARGVVHLDLKPDNVLLREGNSVILTDFGIASTLEGARPLSARSGADTTITAAGTPAFMAPEQFVGDRRGLGPWTDLYGLGCLVWYLLTRRPLFPYSDFFQLLHAHRTELLPPLHLPEDVPVALEGWLQRLLEKSPGARFQQAADAAWALMNLPTEDDDGLETLRILPGSQALTLKALGTPDQLVSTVQIGVATSPSTPPRAAPPVPESWRQVEPLRRSLQLMGAGLNLYGLRPPPFVGREAERDTLWQSLRQVHTTRKAQVVIVQGAAGTGKSRLVEWLCDRSSELGAATILKAVHSPSGGPAEGITPMLVRHLRLGGLSVAEMAGRLRESLRLDHVYDILEISALCRALGGQGEETEPHGVPSGTEEQFSLLVRALEYLSQERPLILWLEDACWAAESLAFVHHLLSRQDWIPFPILVVITSQDESQRTRPVESALLGALASRTETCSLQLSSFTRQEQIVLVCSLLPLELPLAEKVVSRTAGNPLFATQLVGDWVQRGLLVPGPRGFRLKDSRRTTLPDDLHQMWQTHLQHLCEGEPTTSSLTLELLATLGQTVDEPEWRAVCVDAGLPFSERLLQRMLTQRMLVPVDHRGASDTKAWGFSHAMLRESLARAAIDGGRWESHHHQCATTLSHLYPRHTRGVEERIGQHLLAAGRVMEALGPLLAAVRIHHAHNDPERALTLWELRQRRVMALGLGPADRPWAEGNLARAFIHLEQGEPELALRLGESVQYAARAAGWKDLEGISLMHHANCMRWKGNYTSAGVYYQKALALLKQTREQSHATYCLRGLGNIAYQQGNLPRARELYLSALERYRKLGDIRHTVFTLSFLGHLHREMRELDQAELVLKEALALAEQHHLISGLAEIHRNLGILALFHRHDLPLADRHLTYAHQLYERLGQARLQADLSNDLGELTRRRGEFDQAERWYRRSLDLSKTAHSGITECTEFNLCCLLLHQERFAEVDQILAGRPEALLEAGRRRFVPSMRLAQLVCDVAMGRLPQAQVRIEQVAKLFEPQSPLDEDDRMLVERLSPLIRERTPSLLSSWQVLEKSLLAPTHLS